MSRVEGNEIKGVIVLLAEDEVLVRNLLNRILTQHGYTVLVSSNGREALDVAGAFSGKIDLLLSDVHMPEMNGLDLAEQFRQRRPETTILMMSGRYSGELSVLPPANNFIRKPFLPKALISRLEEVLVRRSA